MLDRRSSPGLGVRARLLVPFTVEVEDRYIPYPVEANAGGTIAGPIPGWGRG